MEANRFFTDEELQEIVIRPVDAAKRAIERRNRDELVVWVKRLYKTAKGSYQLRVDWDRYLTDAIYENLGVEGIYEVMPYRGFTEAELEALIPGEKEAEEVYALYDNGEYEKCSEKIQLMHDMAREFHDKRIIWETILMSYIYEKLGEKVLKDAMYKVVRSYKMPSVETTRSGNFRKRVQMCAWGLHTHGEPLAIEEDDEKVSMWMTPCGSGQMVVELGIYDDPEKARAKRIPAGDLTWHLPDFPVYCVHAAVQEMIAIEELGYPDFVNCPVNELKEDPCWQCGKASCRFAVYKNPEDTPEEVYTRLGKVKPDFSKK